MEKVKIQSRLTVFRSIIFVLSCVLRYEPRAAHCSYPVVEGLIFVDKPIFLALINDSSYQLTYFSMLIMSNARGILDNTERKSRSVPTRSWPLHGVIGPQQGPIIPEIICKLPQREFSNAFVLSLKKSTWKGQYLLSDQQNFLMNYFSRSVQK